MYVFPKQGEGKARRMLRGPTVSCLSQGWGAASLGAWNTSGLRKLKLLTLLCDLLCCSLMLHICDENKTPKFSLVILYCSQKVRWTFSDGCG